MNIRKYLVVISLLLLSFAAAAATAPQIENFHVAPQNQFEPGSELNFTVEGTPRARVSVRITGIRRAIALREVEPGVYEGGYTISRRDRIAPGAVMTATLTLRNATAISSRPFGRRDAARAAPPPAAIAPSALLIERFAVAPVERIEPGADLRFALAGTPGAKASLTIEGVTQNLPMQETRSGYYEAAYTIRRLDNFPPGAGIVATLEMRGQTVRARLAQALVADAQPPAVRNPAPRDGETVVGNPVRLPLHITSHANNAEIGGVTEVRGRTAPDARVEVQVQAVASMAGLFGVNQQIYSETLYADQNGNFFFSFQPQVSVPGTRFELTLNASKGDLSREMKLVLFPQK